jgi:integrase/recombinase XerD
VSALAALIASYFEAAAAEGYAASTLASRRLHLTQFSEWCDARGLTTADAITPAVLERYRAWLFRLRREDGVALSWATQANKLTAVRMLLAWATRTKRLTVNPAAELALPRLPKRLPRAVLTVSEMERVLAEPDCTTLLGLRDRAILEVLYSTGIRRMELVGLDLRDLDAERGALFVREGKGKKDRVVPIGERAIRWTCLYLDRVRPELLRRALKPEPRALFLSARGQRIRPTKLTERLHQYLVAAGIDKPGSVHIFRHTMATLMHDAGADIRDLQEILGHTQLSTTEIYTHVSIERLKAVHAKTHPAHLARAGAPAPSSLAAEVKTKSS